MIKVSRNVLDHFAATNDRYSDEAEYLAGQVNGTTFSSLAYYSHLLDRFKFAPEGEEYAAPQKASELALGRWINKI